jgi:hypothetical protein
MAWKVSNVMAMAIDHCESGYGINVVDERGRPVITLIYGEKVEAEEAAKGNSSHGSESDIRWKKNGGLAQRSGLIGIG